MSAEPTDDLELIDLLQELRERFGASATYSRAWATVTAGQVPARRVGGRWKVKRSDAPLAARVLGGRPSEPVPAAA